MVRRTIALLFLSSLGFVFACNDDERCDSTFNDHCEGATAVTCERPMSNGSGPRFGGDPIRREECTSGICGRSCRCSKECDICDAKLVTTVSCDPDPASCQQSCSG